MVRTLQETRAAKALKKDVGDKAKLGAVDCDDDANKALCSKFNVKGFPTIKGFASNGNESHDFDGARDADGGDSADLVDDRRPIEQPGHRHRVDGALALDRRAIGHHDADVATTEPFRSERPAQPVREVVGMEERAVGEHDVIVRHVRTVPSARRRRPHGRNRHPPSAG